MAEQLGAWLDKVLENNPNHWTVVTQHQGNYSMAQKWNYVKMRKMLVPLYDKYGVDLVLQEARSSLCPLPETGGRQDRCRDAPRFASRISVSGPKMYDVEHKFESLMTKIIPNAQMFQTVDVD